MLKIVCKERQLSVTELNWSWLLLGVTLLILPALAQAKLEPQVSYQGTAYQLCAQQRVTKALFFDVVDVGVYYPDCHLADSVFDSQHKLIRFSYLRKVTGIQFTQGADEFLAENLTETEKNSCLNDFTAFNSIYKDVVAKDYYDLFVLPDQGLNLYLNQSPLAQLNIPECTIPYLNIWFGTESMDNDFSELQKKLESLN